MTTKNAQTLNNIPSNPNDGYYLMIKDQKLGAVGKRLLGPNAKLDIPCNLVMNNHLDYGLTWQQTTSPIFQTKNLLMPTSFTGINVNHGGPGLVDAVGKPFFTEDFFENPVAGESTKGIYGVKVAGSLLAPEAVLSDSEDTSKTTYQGLAILNHEGDCDLGNKLLGVPNGAYSPVINIPFGDIYHEAEVPEYESVEISDTSKPIISAGGRIDVIISLGTNDGGGCPNVTIKGMYEIDPIEVMSPGRPSEHDQGYNGENYKVEYNICKDRAELAKAAQTNRKALCWEYVEADLANADNNYLKDSSDPYATAVAFRRCEEHPCGHTPEEVYDSCLDSCTDASSASANDANGGGSPDCYDSFYSRMGGRPPDEWTEAGCACGNKDDDYFGCNFKFLVNLVPPQ
jgi:hypothetical protein